MNALISGLHEGYQTYGDNQGHLQPLQAVSPISHLSPENTNN